jgi:hypothetical protein
MAKRHPHSHRKLSEQIYNEAGEQLLQIISDVVPEDWQMRAT